MGPFNPRGPAGPVALFAPRGPGGPTDTGPTGPMAPFSPGGPGGPVHRIIFATEEVSYFCLTYPEMVSLVGLCDTTSLLIGLLLPALVYVLVVVAKFLVWLRKDIRLGSKFPSPPYHWLYGNNHLTDFTFGEKYLSVIREVVEKHPQAHSFWMAGINNTINITHPETIKQLLKSQSNGLFMSNGDTWKVRRRLLTPAFHFDILKQYVSVYNREATEMISKLLETTKRGQVFEMFQEASMCTLETILQCAFSGGQTSDETKNEYVEAIRKLEILFIEMVFNPIFIVAPSAYKRLPRGREYTRLCKFVHNTSESIIAKRRQQLMRDGRPQQKTGRLDFLDILLLARYEDGTGLTDLEIREEVDTFMFAGHETTASALSWTLYSLAQHPHHQDKVREEVNHLLSGREEDTIQWEDLHKLPYLTMCLKEALRLHSPVPLIVRTMLEDTVIDGVTVPKGFEIGIHLNCIGQNFAMNEVKVLLARLIDKFVFEVDPTRPAKKEVLIVMNTRDGMWMKATPV
ncbi:CYP4F2 [Branchiostoma lanceolatum]|uniref:CYP4F2 protein n=1 Tax=Branchiostoma lanceolatum TaxID=7740 RepID=A0A8J9Z7C6_BRALA|nr:CYP4F2 [Branchiostoma lanceolatum]